MLLFTLSSEVDVISPLAVTLPVIFNVVPSKVILASPHNDEAPLAVTTLLFTSESAQKPTPTELAVVSTSFPPTCIVDPAQIVSDVTQVAPQVITPLRQLVPQKIGEIIQVTPQVITPLRQLVPQIIGDVKQTLLNVIPLGQE
jgi:hypothetical protein